MEKSGSQVAAPAAGGAAQPITTFVQADSAIFREVVQRLTSPPSEHGGANHDQSEAVVKAAGKKPTFKLHERRQYKNSTKLEIVKPAGSHQFKPSTFVLRPPTPYNYSSEWRMLSPSTLSGADSSGFVSISPSSGTPNASNKRGSSTSSSAEEEEEEEKAIKERRFYLHPSPRSKPGGYYYEPELLTLFPLTSPTSK